MAASYTSDEKEKGGAAPPRGYEAGEPEIDPVAEKKLVRKLDLHIVPLVMALYMLSFLDRYVQARSLIAKDLIVD